jgi:secreted trypsin-like serine protease
MLAAAAHCVHGEGASQVNVGVFLHTLLPNYDNTNSHESVCSEVIQVEQIHKHPSYNDFTLPNDIALLRLSKSPRCDSQIEYATLATSTPVTGTDLIVAGCGALWTSGSDGNPNPLPPKQYPNVPPEVILDITSELTCRKYVGFFKHQAMFCAGFAGGGKDSCKSDSGGPLFAMSGGPAVVSGSVSWGDRCAGSVPGFGVYTCVSNYAGPGGWIENVMNGIGAFYFFNTPCF